MGRTVTLLLAGLAAGSLLAACGDDDGGDAAATEDTATRPADEPGGADVVTVSAVDFGYEDLPDSVPAGTRLELVNTADAELHELVAFRLADDETRSADELMHLPEAELGAILSAGPPSVVLLAAPGADQVAAVGDGTLAEPGRYLIICAIPTGVDPDEYLAAAAESGNEPPDVPGGPPHFAAGMYADLTVE